MIVTSMPFARAASTANRWGGYRDSPSGDWAWIPIVDDHNEWVQAGAREKCIKFLDMYGEKPEWGWREKAAETARECHVLHECYIR